MASSADAGPSRPRRRAGSRSLPVPGANRTGPFQAPMKVSAPPLPQRAPASPHNRGQGQKARSADTTGRVASAKASPHCALRPPPPRRTARCARQCNQMHIQVTAYYPVTSHLYISFTYFDCILNAGGLNTHMNHMSRDQPSAQEFTKYIAHPSPAPGRLSALAI